jgi:hypothetical protein
MNLLFVSFTAATTKEVATRKREQQRAVTYSQNNPSVKSQASVAVIRRNSVQNDNGPRGSLACALPWGHGWGWATLPNGIWSGGKVFTHPYISINNRFQNLYSTRTHVVTMRGRHHSARHAHHPLYKRDRNNRWRYISHRNGRIRLSGRARRCGRRRL